MDDLEMTELTPKQENYQNLAETIINKFNARGIEGYYCIDREEANAKAKRFLYYIMGRFSDTF